MSVHDQTPTPQAPPTKVEVSWDDALDGNFPPTRQQRVQQAAVKAAEQLHEEPTLQVTHDRLTKALNLVLTQAVTIHPDDTATVRSGSHTYQIADHCTCADAQHSTAQCKHWLAAEIHRRATALLQGSAPTPERAAPSTHPPEAPAAAAPPAPPSAPRTSATWDVHEAPTSACFKFRVQTMELTYTLRGIDDAELTPRISTTLPLLQEIIDACEDRYAARAAAREAAQTAQAAAPEQSNGAAQGPPGAAHLTPVR